MASLVIGNRAYAEVETERGMASAGRVRTGKSVRGAQVEGAIRINKTGTRIERSWHENSEILPPISKIKILFTFTGATYSMGW